MSTFTLMLGIAFSVFLQTAPSSDPVDAQKPAVPKTGYVGEVTTNDLYVRSGPSTNYYPVTKLNAGARVRVIDREGDWLGIVPPPGCFSLMADAYIDTGGGKRGVVNGDNVRVRAGSLLNEKKYAIQTKLSTGAEVELLGHTEGMYYKIVPPQGCKLWLSAQYVQRVPDSVIEAEAAGKIARPLAEASPALTEAPSTVSSTADPSGSPTETTAELTASITPLSADQIKDLRRQMEELDAQVKAETTKPLLRRELAPFVQRFQTLADQSDDEYIRLYAATRIGQIRDMMDMIEAVRQMRDLREQVRTDRTDALAGRAGIRPRPIPIGDGFDVQGELRPSAVYNSPAGPRRYRLVDPSKTPVRTVGYVEIPADSAIKAEDFLGRLVGVNARDIQLQTGDVDPIYIYVADRIVALESSGE